MRAVLLSALLAAGGENAPPAYQSAQEFTDAVRAATARYHDRSTAIAEGYRLIGRDFPGMGEHWINIALVFDGRHEPTRPEFLSYVTVAGVPKLVGVAYAVPLMPGESPPSWPWADVSWHDHARTVDEETLLPHHREAGLHGHAAVHHSGGQAVAEEPRLAMAHAWVWLRNADGDFVSDNWALPYFRLGLSPAEGAPVASARALALLTGAAEYITEVVAAGGGSPSERRALQRAFARAQRLVRTVLDRRSGRQLGPQDLADLADIWKELWKTLDRRLAAPARARVEPLR
jgi:hypothetical protein